MKLLWIFVIIIVGFDAFKAYKLYRESEDEEKSRMLSRFLIRIAFIVLAVLIIIFGRY
ncbi:MAG: hypothetical protein J7L34_07535 [Thermotogaceae bacterium]|nr:hypothetical protein [Thermotogaceae bacterium]